MGDVDPRFDPVFQRGYRPEEAPARAPAATPADTAPAAEGETRDDVADDPADDAPEQNATELDPPPHRRIRYRLVLLVVSLAAILTGAALVWFRLAADPLDVDYGSDPAQLFWTQLLNSLVLPLLMAGLTGLILWLALGALRDRDDA